MSSIQQLIDEIEEDRYDNERAVDLSDVKQWVRYALEAVKEDLEATKEQS